jgi:hypothetical protein
MEEARRWGRRREGEGDGRGGGGGVETIPNVFGTILTYIYKLSQESIFKVFNFHFSNQQRPYSWTKSRQKSSEFSSLPFKVTLYNLALRFLFLQNHATSYSFYCAFFVIHTETSSL